MTFRGESRRGRWAAVVVATMLLVFVVPWFVPAFRRVASDSYMFGFSNAFALASFGAILAVLAIRPRWFFSERAERAAAEIFRPPPSGMTRIPMILLSGFSAALVAVFWLKSASSYFGEASQFFHGIDAVLLGAKPYRDFSFPYGPLFLYAPLAVAAFSGGAIRIDAAYIVVLVAELVAGLMMLEFVIRRLDLPRVFAIALYALVALAGCNLTMGENYTPFRYLIPYVALFLVTERIRAAAPDRVDAAPFGIAAACAGFAALVSPEIGLVTGAALAAAFVAESLRGRRALALGAPLSLAMPAIVALLFSREYFSSIFAFGAGGYNFPVLPTAHIVFYLASAMIAVPLLASRRDGLGAGLAIAMTMLAASALGRCDAGHVYWNGMMAFVLATALLARLRPRAGIAWLSIFGVVFTLGIQLSFWNHYGPSLRSAIAERRRMDSLNLSPFRNHEFWARGRSAGSPFLWSKMAPPGPELKKLARYPRIGTPIEYSEEIDRYLKLSGKFIQERVPAPVIGILNEEQLAKKLEDVRKMDVLLFPISYHAFEGPISSQEAADRSAFLSSLLLFPVRLHFRNEPFAPEREVVADILERFHPVDQVWSYEVMVRNSAATAAPAGSSQ